ncbi:MAG: hypothetical protein EPO68_00775 [Planctomycetota bacterium]|nr:MAG: hypothetical protein EPO68_00775 [Planctomycetota bacterium]
MSGAFTGVRAWLCACALGALAPLFAQDSAPASQPAAAPDSRPTAARPLWREAWQLEGGACETLFEADSTLLVVPMPVLKLGKREVRATWAVFWLDRDELSRLSPTEAPDGTFTLPPPSQRKAAQGRPNTLFEGMKSNPLANLAREAYLEGPIEYFDEGQLVGTASALYIDLVDGHGWIADAAMQMRQRVFGRRYDLRARAKWLRHSADGTLRASDAVVTTCDFEEPHLYITSKDLRIKPNPESRDAPWRLDLRQNRITFYGWLTLPLPRYTTSLDEDYRPTLDSLRFGNSGRFGFSLGLKFNIPVGRVGRTLNRVLRGDPKQAKANSSLSVALHGSRGLLLDAGLELESPKRYWIDMYLGAVPDSGDDRGLIEVPEEDRDLLRLWFRARGRYLLDEKQWLDVALSKQSDAGVQSEFWESDFLRYERRDNYVHWRRAREESYLASSVKWRLDDFRTDIEELPSITWYQGRKDVLTLGSSELTWSGNATAAYLRRKEGELGFASPFELPSVFPDGFGDRDVLRADATQRLELPIATGAAGLRWTPFVEARGTAWSEDTTEEDAPTRGGLFAGMRLSTSFYKSLAGGGLAQFAPRVEVRGDLATEESGGAPVQFDQVEDSIEGRFVEAGFYSRFPFERIKTTFDLDARVTHAADVASGVDDGWQPLGIYAGLSTEIGGIPVGVIHDGRYGLSPAETAYTLTSIGLGIEDKWGIEASHRYGRDLFGAKLYEAATIAARYRWTPKWEFEARQTFSLSGEGTLNTKGILRRYGHDMVFQIEAGARSGEGGGTLSFSFRPRVNWDPSDIGLLDPWDA